MNKAASKPRAVSLLDKYADLNSRIDDARKRVGELRNKLDQTNDRIDSLRDSCDAQVVETEHANAEKLRLETTLKEAKDARADKLAEEERTRRENRVAKSQLNGVRKRIDDERHSFLERCREFRQSCKRMRVAASILVLDGGGNFDAKDASDDVDLWRRLQDECFSDEDEESGESDNGKRKHKKSDPEVEEAEREEKESREALIEAECALNSVSAKNDDATKTSTP